MKTKKINPRSEMGLFLTATLCTGFDNFFIDDCQLLLMRALLITNESLLTGKFTKSSQKDDLVDIVKLKFKHGVNIEVTSSYDIVGYCQSVSMIVSTKDFEQSVFYTDNDLREKTPNGLLKEMTIDLQNLFDDLKGTKI